MMRIRPLCHLSGSYDQAAEYSFTTDERKSRQWLVNRAEIGHSAAKPLSPGSIQTLEMTHRYERCTVRRITEPDNRFGDTAGLVTGLAAVGISGRTSYWGCPGDRCWPGRCSGIWPGHFFSGSVQKQLPVVQDGEAPPEQPIACEVRLWRSLALPFVSARALRPECQVQVTRSVPNRRCLPSLACPLQICHRRLNFTSRDSMLVVNSEFPTVPAAELRSSCLDALRTTR